MDLSDARVAQILIPVEDLDQGVKFYRDTLGLRLLFQAPPEMSFFEVGGLRLLVAANKGRVPERASTVYFQVADIHETHRTLTDRGVAFRTGPHVVHRTPSSELWLSEFQDPDGNRLALMSERPTVAAP